MSRPAPREPRPDLVHTWPYLVRIEAQIAALVLALLLAWATFADAPLGPPADGAWSAEAPWYLGGLALLGRVFDPWIAAVALPALAVFGLAAIPYVDPSPAGNGYYVFHGRRFAVSAFLLGFVGLWIAPIVASAFLRGSAAPGRDLPTPIGVALALLWLIALPAAYRQRQVKSPTLRALGPVRYWLVALLFQAMTGTVIKLVLRLAFGIRYLAAGLGF